ncbi:hypothetical protein HBI23_254140 [Parastagonospora nodorum]|nr:hypothetical protein HBI23_254140 [Parastagonospora nodorum]KAH5621370.1 hypothetical protein HBI51_250300 [Parastagonospora nodorum]KAH5983374.1 hypothetical protein HBI84_248210 [Parastagonospora nodorum]KAH6133489.1 hypothetical protein HBI68_253790 [Parastagonospora nodorum]KAH6380436.1 hypothetical protein HBI08_240020 [Parastagonospora nodorum]
MDDASPTEQLAYPSDRTILLQIFHSIASIEHLVARILDVAVEGETTKQRQAESMATYIKQLGLQLPADLNDQSGSIARRDTAYDDPLIDRPLCETTEHSLSPSPQQRNVQEDQTDQACSARSAGGTMSRTEQVDDTVPAYPPIRDGDIEFERIVEQRVPKRQALKDITDESDDHARKRRRKNSEV